MRKIIILSAAVAALSFGAAHAQDVPKPASDAPVLPKACGVGAETGGMDHGGEMASMPGMDDAQKAYMASMDKMNGPMMAAHAIKDPDLAFNCGMIAHHTGAIEMSKVVLKYGKDPAARDLANRIIAAQEHEIAEMTAWIDKHAKK